MQTSSDRAGLDLKDRCRLLGVQSFDVAEDDDVTRIVGQRENFFAEELACLGLRKLVK